MNFFKNLFGLDLEPQNSKQRDPHGDSFHQKEPSFHEGLFHENNLEESIPDFNRSSFDMFSNPIEMHRYFEKQMDEMLKSFGFFSDGMPNFGGFFSHHGMPSIEDGTRQFFYGNQPNENQTSSIRDHFLKRGYEHPESQPVDKDVDTEFNMGDLGSILGQKDSHSQTPHQPQAHSSFFGQSVSIKTKRNFDGSVETQKTIKNSDGSQETHVTRKLGDKEYTITRKKDRNGQEEVIENMINIGEKEKQGFIAPNKNLPKLENDPTKNNLWDKFFK